MKKLYLDKIIIVIFLLSINISCAQYHAKPLAPNKNKLMKKPLKLERLINVLNSPSELSINDDGLCCYKIGKECNVLDGKTTIYSHYQTQGDDNPTLIPYIFAEGEFLKGQYNGIWNFFDKKSNVIKIETWNNGILISTKN